MKKIIFLCMAVVSLAACSSSDDDAPAAAADLILGTWQLESNLDNGTELTNTCTRQSTVAFLPNGNHTRIEYNLNEGTCENYTFAATWENLGNNSYKLNYSNGVAQTTTFNFLESNTKFNIIIKEAVINGVTYQEIKTYKKI